MKKSWMSYWEKKFKENLLLLYLRIMQSIKISSKTKEKIEQTQAELLLKHNQKVSQSDLLEKIVEKAIGTPAFMEGLFYTQPNVPSPPRTPIRVKIVSRKKPDMRLFPDEWED